MEFDRPIIIALILFAILMLIFFLVAPEYGRLQTLEMNLAQKKAEYNAQFEYFSEITKNYYLIQSRKDDMQKIDDALPSKPDFGQLVYYYQKKAKESGLVLKNLTLSQSGTGTNVKDIVFSLNLVGNYSSLANFISSLESSARLFEVSSISFGTTAQQPNLSPANNSKIVNQFQNTDIFTFSLEIKAHSY